MADEAVIIELFNGGRPVRYTVANGAAGTDIPKGSIMELTSSRTMVLNTGAGKVIAGILAHEKVGGDGSTTATVWTDGIFQLKTLAGTGSTTLGSYVRTAGAAGATINHITVCTTLDQETGKSIGRALNTAGAAADALIRVNL